MTTWKALWGLGKHKEGGALVTSVGGALHAAVFAQTPSRVVAEWPLGKQIVREVIGVCTCLLSKLSCQMH